MGEAYTRQSGWSVGHPTYPGGGLFVGSLISGVWFEGKRNRLTVGHVSCVAMLAPAAVQPNVGCPTEASCLDLYTLSSSANK